MSDVIHYGIMRAPDGSALRTIPDVPGIESDADSFLDWGATIDRTHHFIVPVEGEDVDYRTLIPQQREAIAKSLSHGARMVDYVVVTDAEDWSERARVWLIDGTMS